MTIEWYIQELINQSIALELIAEDDEIYTRNRLLALLKLDDFHLEGDIEGDRDTDPLDAIIDYACQNGIIGTRNHEKDIFEAQVMDCFIARPSIIKQEFYKRFEKDPSIATNYFYKLSQNSRYIKMKDIRKNINYKVDTDYGALDITINLSKPEKDPKAISEVKETKGTGYPKCLLCIENEGYQGRQNHPARANHRIMPVSLLGKTWFLQYSPYVYYNEHCILLSKTHRNMKIDKETFQNLLAFVVQFPHYFIGSNADLPIVGGSILSHDHYQGGCYEFPMAMAEQDFSFSLKNHSDVQASIIRWPMPVIRLQGDNQQSLVSAADMILNKWRHYSDPVVEIIAFTGNTPHNTITPIARKRNGNYELDLVLRNNRTSDEHPLGIFHPHQDVHHIKKENIGLIEVMGLAVLPGRLHRELQEVEKYLLGQENAIKDYHLPWARSLKEVYKDSLTEAETGELIRYEVGQKYKRVLDDAAVFKRDDIGKAAMRRFIEHLNKEED